MIEHIFGKHAERRHCYFCLQDDNLHDPDIYIANGREEKALFALSYLGPSTLRPALLVTNAQAVADLGSSDPAYPRIGWPVRAEALLPALDALVEKRAHALAELEASDIVTVPERRRRYRLFPQRHTADDYARMRRPQVDGGILIIDKNLAFRNYVAELMAKRPVPVVQVNHEPAAVDECRRQKISIVFVNTSTPGIDSYRLSRTIKTQIADRVAVVFLVRNPQEYDQAAARTSGCDGYLVKPVANRSLLSAIKKFHPVFWH